MKLNFAEMSTKELRAYVLAYREDVEAIEVLFSRRTPDSEAIKTAAKKTPGLKTIAEQLGERFKAIRGRTAKAASGS